MFLATALAALVAFTTAMPNPLFDPNFDALIEPRTTPCQTPGSVHCNGRRMYGICAASYTITWQAVAAGTICDCSQGQCVIIRADGGWLGLPIPSFKHKSSSSPQPTASPSASPSHKHKSGSHSSWHASASTKHTPSASPPSGNYTTYTGNGSIAAGWPSQNEWKSFEELWTGYEPTIGKNCLNLPTPVRNNHESETQELKAALLAKSKQCGVPAEYALAEVMQESMGCVAVATTSWSHANPGIFQSYEGASCFGMKTCSAAQIHQMAEDGMCGTSKGPGFEQDVKCEAIGGSTGAEKWYKVARIYNAGSIPSDGDLGAPGATPCYCSDIANRLVGDFFSGTSQCTL